MAEIVGVGHACQDYLCIVREYPPEDGSTRILDIKTQGGGAVATALVAAARLGAKAAFIGIVGTDSVGDIIAQDLQDEEVDISGVQRLEGVTSLTSYVMIQPERGTRTKFPLIDRLPLISWNEEQRTLLKSARILHLDGTNYENAIKAAELAKEYGVLISLDGSTRQPENRLNQDLASLADILITSAVYPGFVTGCENLPEALQTMGTWGPKIVMATAGSKGVFALKDGKIKHYAAKPAKVVDTTGAGDVFHGAYLVAYLRGQDFDSCIDFAQAAAAKKCEQIGGRTGIPTLKEMESDNMV